LVRQHWGPWLLFEILEDEVRICLGLLGVTGFAELTESCVREAPAVVRAHLHSAFPHLNLPQSNQLMAV
jgi:hypothetical protein